MAGLIHIYCGEGKGKTTAAVGLAVRAAGAGKKVVFTQFFKDGTSSEIGNLRCCAGVQVMHCQTVKGFYGCMSDGEKKKAGADYTQLFLRVFEAAQSADMLILDEILSACNHKVVPQALVLDSLRHKPDNLEVVLTGRNPPRELLELADYVTQMQKVKHPFDRGIPARKGIEY